MKKIQIEIKWAFIFIGMMLSWMAMEMLTGLHGEHIDLHPIYTNFVAIIAIIVYVFALKDKRKNFYNGVMTYKEGFISGMIMTLIITIFAPLNQYLTSEVISPEYFTNAIAYAVDNNKLTLVEAQAYFNLGNYMTQATIATPFMGLITTAIVAFFVKKK